MGNITALPLPDLMDRLRAHVRTDPLAQYPPVHAGLRLGMGFATDGR